jgi:CheY-like chemotaxis protein
VDADLVSENEAEARELRRLRTPAELAIVLLAWPGQARGAEALHGSGAVTKPVKPRVLATALQAAMAGRAPHAPKPAAPSAEAPLAPVHPLAILLAEDNPVNQRVATLILQRLGYRVEVAANGREAVEAVAARPYDLVLRDLQMPEMDGLEATRTILGRTGQPRPRIVAMTANASSDDRERCLQAGMADFLAKPVRPADLRRVLAATPQMARRAAG